MPRRSLEHKLLMGGLKLGQYLPSPKSLGAATVALSLLGCIHIPKPISTSENGRYITYSTRENGKLAPLTESYKGATMVLYDTEKNRIVNTFEINGPPIWPTNTGDTIAYMSSPEGNSDLDKETSIIIQSKGKRKVIKKAAYPDLSADGQYIAFTRLSNKQNANNISDNFSIFLREIKTGKERNLNVPGIAADFSPDNKNLAYIKITKEGKGYVETLDLKTGDKKIFGEVIGNELYGTTANPKWIDNNRIIYSGKAAQGKDSEIFIATKKGGITQVTDNTLEEMFTTVAPNGDVHYLGVDPNNKKNSASFVASQTIIGWKSKKESNGLVSIAGNKAIVEMGGNMYITPITNLKKWDPKKVTDISKQVVAQQKTRKVGQKIGELGKALIDLLDK